MLSGESVVRFFETLLTGIGVLLQHKASSYCHLSSVNDRYTLISSNSSLVSVMRIDGQVEQMGGELFGRVVGMLDTTLHSGLTERGHALQWVFRYNPDGEAVRESIRRHLSGFRKTMGRIGLDAEISDAFIDDWVEALAPWCAEEATYIVAWTFPAYLAPAEEKAARKEMVARRGNAPMGMEAMPLEVALEPLVGRHTSYTDEIVTAFTNAGYLIEKMDVASVMRTIRLMLDEHGTSERWCPSLPVAMEGEDHPAPPPVRLPDDAWDDYGILMYPDIPGQLINHEPEHVAQEVVRINDRLYGNVLMRIPPRTPQPFNALFRSMIRHRMPWQASFFIEGDGFRFLALKRMLAGFFIYGSSETKRLHKALLGLSGLRNDGKAIPSFQAAFTTWVDESEHESFAAAKKALNLRVNKLSSTVQGWGAADTDRAVGDPWLGVAATLPAFMSSSPGRRSVGELSDILAMMPLGRPGRVWRHGAVLPRTPDGRLVPYEPMSSRQEAWIDLTVAPMGGGKSVRLNAFDLAFLFLSGLTRLPWIAKIDIGPSSKGFIRLLKALLPPEMRHMALYERLRLEKRFMINVMDLPLGCEQPFPSRLSFVVNFLSVLGTEMGESAPPDGVTALAEIIVTAAYDRLSREKRPTLYQAGLDAEVDEALQNLDFRFDEATSWWEVVDALFDAGETRLASKAQRFAMPTLSYLVQLLNDATLTADYQYTIAGSTETLAAYFRRKLVEAIGLYKIIGGETRYDTGEARVVSLDLDEVAPRGTSSAERQTVVMFMLARHVTAGQFYDSPEDLVAVPERYRAYQRKRITSLREDPKRFDMDEAHRFLRNEGARKQVEADISVVVRESRKWNLSVGLSTQNLDDIPPELLELIGSVYIMGVGTPSMAEKIAETYGMPQVAVDTMLNLRKPSKAGSEMLVWHRTDKGRITQHQVLTLGGLLLTALNTTTEDVQVRDRLDQKIGYMAAIRLISAVYPGGVKKEVERRRQLLEESSLYGEEQDIVEEIVNELYALHEKHIAERVSGD